jgi:hypothetical protein
LADSLNQSANDEVDSITVPGWPFFLAKKSLHHADAPENLGINATVIGIQANPRHNRGLDMRRVSFGACAQRFAKLARSAAS